MASLPTDGSAPRARPDWWLLRRAADPVAWHAASSRYYHLICHRRPSDRPVLGDAAAPPALEDDPRERLHRALDRHLRLARPTDTP